MRFYPFVLIAMTFMVASCTSIEKKDENFHVVATDAIKYAKLNLEEIASDNDQSIKKGEEDNLKFFAPETFKRATYYRDKVKKNIQKEQNRAEIIRETELLKKYLLESYAVKETISTELKDILEVNQFLLALGADVAYKSDFNSFQKKIGEMIQQYDEKRSPDAFKDRPPLLAEMQRVEAQATIDKVLAPARSVFADLKERSLEKIAPISLREGQEVFAAAEKAIWKDCRDQENLTRVGAKALFWAKRARNISEETVRLKELKKEEFESIVLDGEKRLYSIDNALGTDDFRDLRLNDHAAALVKEAKKRAALDAAPVKAAIEPVKGSDPALPLLPAKAMTDPVKNSGALIQELSAEPVNPPIDGVKSSVLPPAALSTEAALPTVIPVDEKPKSFESSATGKDALKN